jgi:hypothetical protein
MSLNTSPMFKKTDIYLHLYHYYLESNYGRAYQMMYALGCIAFFYTGDGYYQLC